MKRDLNRFLIINADDFGLSTTVNEGIIDSYTNGIVTSTSMMLTMSSFEHAFNKAEEFPDLDIGIHIDLSWGNPLSKPVDIPSLVNSNGKFLGKKKLFFQLLFNHISLVELECEILAQVKFFKQSGLRLFHADVHQHFHCFPIVMKALMNVAILEEIPYVRLPLELSFSSFKN